METLEEIGAVNPRRATPVEAAIRSFEVSNSTPYRNQAEIELQNDGTFATVRLIAEFRQDINSPWLEKNQPLTVRKLA